MAHRPFSHRSHNSRRVFSSNRFNRRSAPRLNQARYIYSVQEIPTTEQVKVSATFKDFAFSDDLQKNITHKGYENPTQIQAETIPAILEGRDILGQSKTGSGKTGAFLLPLIEKTSKDSTQSVLIIVPNRELALQIQKELREFSQNMPVRSVLVIGGESMYRQRKELRNRFNFVIGTPGRLKDIAQQKVIDFKIFNNLVLDEVDRMLDMGFIHDITWLIKLISQKRQTLFFSATSNRKTNSIASTLLNNPKVIEIKDKSNTSSVNQNVVKVRAQMDKVNKLHELLLEHKFPKTLVFVRTKRSSDKLARELRTRGHQIDAIHGDKSQGQRKQIIQKFRDNRFNILIATDVVSRGLDIADITHVINFDEPENYDDYTHRIGRTGRNGKIGHALTFVIG